LAPPLAPPTLSAPAKAAPGKRSLTSEVAEAAAEEVGIFKRRITSTIIFQLNVERRSVSFVTLGMNLSELAHFIK
jgi:hypothetical protein